MDDPKQMALAALYDALTGARGESVKLAIRILCGMEKESFRETPHEMAYAAGMRDAGRKILKIAEIDLDKMFQEIKERNQL